MFGLQRRMIISRIMRAPLGVQINRAAFLLYAVLFAFPLWRFRHTTPTQGILIFGCFVFCSLLGLGYSFVRIPRARWVLAALDLVIPAVFWASMCLLVFSRPVWWEWPLALLLWFTIPVALAVLLFTDRKTREYFST